MSPEKEVSEFEQEMVASIIEFWSYYDPHLKETLSWLQWALKYTTSKRIASLKAKKDLNDLRDSVLDSQDIPSIEETGKIINDLVLSLEENLTFGKEELQSFTLQLDKEWISKLWIVGLVLPQILALRYLHSEDITQIIKVIFSNAYVYQDPILYHPPKIVIKTIFDSSKKRHKIQAIWFIPETKKEILKERIIPIHPDSEWRYFG